MRDFITCLEFLTRIRFSKRDNWTKEDFSRSVPYFPLVGLVIGSFLALCNYGLLEMQVSPFFDMMLTHDTITGRYYSFKDGWYSGGFEMIIYPMKMRNGFLHQIAAF